MISNRSEASHKKPRDLAAGQKMGWVRHSDVDGLYKIVSMWLRVKGKRKKKKNIPCVRFAAQQPAHQIFHFFSFLP